MNVNYKTVLQLIKMTVGVFGTMHEVLPSHITTACLTGFGIQSHFKAFTAFTTNEQNGSVSRNVLIYIQFISNR